MSKTQLNRLTNDLIELNNYIDKIKGKGNFDLLSKLKRKRDFLKSKLVTSSQEEGLAQASPFTHMPSYTMINLKTNEEQDMVLTLSEREELLATGDYKQKLSTAKFASSSTSTLRQAGREWGNFLTKVKKDHPGSTVND